MFELIVLLLLTDSMMGDKGCIYETLWFSGKDLPVLKLNIYTSTWPILRHFAVFSKMPNVIADGWPLGLHFQELCSQLLPLLLPPELLNSSLPLCPLLHLTCPRPVQEERPPKSWSHGLWWAFSQGWSCNAPGKAFPGVVGWNCPPCTPYITLI